MRFKVKSYNKAYDYHECIDLNDGKKHFFDIMVSGKHPEGTAPEDLIGKEFVTYKALLNPYISIVQDLWPLEVKDDNQS